MDRSEVLTRRRIQKLLDVYDFEELLAENDLTVEDAVLILIQEGHIAFPETEPV